MSGLFKALASGLDNHLQGVTIWGNRFHAGGHKAGRRSFEAITQGLCRDTVRSAHALCWPMRLESITHGHTLDALQIHISRYKAPRDWSYQNLIYL